MSVATKSLLDEDQALCAAKTSSGPNLRLVETVNSASNARRLIKALFEDRALHIKIRSANSAAEKHAILKDAGLTPISDEELLAEFKSCLAMGAPEATPDPEAATFVHNMLHLASANSSDNGFA